MKIGIIGTGISVVGFLKNLKGSHDVKVFDKAFKLGGRLTMHRINHCKLNLGAQYINPQSNEFKEVIINAGCSPLNGSVIDAKTKEIVDSSNFFIHEDGLDTIVKKHLKYCDVLMGAKVTGIDLDKGKLIFENGDSELFDLIISSVPIQQLEQLCEFDVSNENVYSKCIALGALVKDKNSFKFNCYKNFSKAISWLALSSSFCSQSPITLTAHLTPELSDDLFSSSNDQIEKIATDDIVKRMNIKNNESIEPLKIFKWRYALCQRNNQGDGFVKLNKLIAIGDWTLGPRVESAYESGKKAAIALNI
jgi:predicted NAD/FAD-dependent oxidoreductase